MEAIQAFSPARHNSQFSKNGIDRNRLKERESKDRRFFNSTADEHEEKESARSDGMMDVECSYWCYRAQSHSEPR